MPARWTIARFKTWSATPLETDDHYLASSRPGRTVPTYR